MPLVTLTEADLAFADYVAALRHWRAVEAGRPDTFTPDTFTPLDAHRQGARAELAFADWSGLTWATYDENPFVLPGDVGPVEIRSTELPTGRLILTAKDVAEKGNRPFVLVLADGATFDLVGWRRASSPPSAWWKPTRNRNGGAYFVPRSALKTMDTLPELSARLDA